MDHCHREFTQSITFTDCEEFVAAIEEELPIDIPNDNRLMV